MTGDVPPREKVPSIARLREVTQPQEVVGRRSAEHWTGDLYLRRISPYLTRQLLRTPVSANGVTWLMILSGWSAAAALLVPGLVGAVLAVLLAQLQMLLDCCDGEVARWRQTFSPAGVFLDRVGHYTTESFIPLALGVRAAGGLDDVSAHYGWTTLGAVLAVVILLNKSLNDMVHVARSFSGMDRMPDTEAVRAPRTGAVAAVRRAARFVPFHRLYHSIEMTLLILAAAIVDAVQGDLSGTQVLLVVLVPLSILSLVGHLVAILASDRVRPS